MLLFSDRGGAYRRNHQAQESERITVQSSVPSQQQFYTNGPPLSSTRERVLSPAVNGKKPIASINSLAMPAQLAVVDQLRGPNVWIKKWVDYSSKYGLGYLLSNNATGVFFNDSTKIVIDFVSQVPGGKSLFYYYERKSISASEKQDVMTTHSLLDFPKELQKKVTLLQHFRSYLENNAQQPNGTNGPTSGKSANVDADVEMHEEPVKGGAVQSIVYVKKWMRTKHAIMFRLSNKIVQVSFQDHTEILLNSESRLVTYVNKKGERSTLPLNQALESNNAEMTKRLKYTKDILTHMLNNNTHTTNRGATPSQGGTPSSGGQPLSQLPSQSIHPTIHSAAQGKRLDMLTTQSSGLQNTIPSEFQTLTSNVGSIGTVSNLPHSAAIGSHRRPLNIIN